MNTPILIAALFTIAKMGKQPECPQQIKRISNIRENVAWHIRTMGYYSVFKEKKLRNNMMNPKDTKLR